MMSSTRGTQSGFSNASRRAARTIKGSLDITLGGTSNGPQLLERGLEAFNLCLEFSKTTSFGPGSDDIGTAFF